MGWGLGVLIVASKCLSAAPVWSLRLQPTLAKARPFGQPPAVRVHASGADDGGGKPAGGLAWMGGPANRRTAAPSGGGGDGDGEGLVMALALLRAHGALCAADPELGEPEGEVELAQRLGFGPMGGAALRGALARAARARQRLVEEHLAPVVGRVVRRVRPEAIARGIDLGELWQVRPCLQEAILPRARVYAAAYTLA